MVQLKKKVKLKQKNSPQAQKNRYKKGVWFGGLLVLLIVLLCVIFVPKGWKTDLEKGKDTCVLNYQKDTISVAKDTASNQALAKSSIKTDSKGSEPSIDVIPDNSDVQRTSDGVNEPQGGHTVTPAEATADVKTEALSVIRGNYGNNPVRRRLLGDRYQEIQNKVNEMYHNGLVH